MHNKCTKNQCENTIIITQQNVSEDIYDVVG